MRDGAIKVRTKHDLSGIKAMRDEVSVLGGKRREPSRARRRGARKRAEFGVLDLGAIKHLLAWHQADNAQAFSDFFKLPKRKPPFCAMVTAQYSVRI